MACQALPMPERHRYVLLGGGPASAAGLRRGAPGCSADALRSAFRRVSLLCHPDKNRERRAAEAFGMAKQALDALLPLLPAT